MEKDKNFFYSRKDKNRKWSSTYKKIGQHQHNQKSFLSSLHDLLGNEQVCRIAEIIQKKPIDEKDGKKSSSETIHEKIDLLNQRIFKQDNSIKTNLPYNIRNRFECFSGINLSDVKVHKNSPKPLYINAHAYTKGSNIYVAPGQEKHLPHEAWHVVQQKQGRVEATMQMKGVNINDDSKLEREADEMGRRAVKGVGKDNIIVNYNLPSLKGIKYPVQLAKDKSTEKKTVGKKRKRNDKEIDDEANIKIEENAKKRRKICAKDFPKIKIFTVNIGQGDCTLIITGEKMTIIDAGTDTKGVKNDNKKIKSKRSSFYLAMIKQEIKDLINSNNIKKIDIIITHGDSDHWSLMEKIIDNIEKEHHDIVFNNILIHDPTKEAQLSEKTKKNKKNQYHKFYDKLVGKDKLFLDKENMYSKLSTSEVKIDTDKFRRLRGGSAKTFSYYQAPGMNNKNDQSFVTKYRINQDVLYLNMGDLQKKGEETIFPLSRINKKNSRTYQAIILKAGHHGSKTSSHENLEKYLCKKLEKNGTLIILVSVGINNQHNLPTVNDNKLHIIKFADKFKSKGYKVETYMTSVHGHIETIGTELYTGLSVDPAYMAPVPDVKSFEYAEPYKKSYENTKNSPKELLLVKDPQIFSELIDASIFSKESGKHTFLSETSFNGNGLYDAVNIALNKPYSSGKKLRDEVYNWAIKEKENMKKFLIGPPVPLKDHKDPVESKPGGAEVETKVTGSEDVIDVKDSDFEKVIKSDKGWSGIIGDVVPFLIATVINRPIFIYSILGDNRMYAISNKVKFDSNGNPMKGDALAGEPIKIFYNNYHYTNKPQPDVHKGYDGYKKNFF